MRHETWTHVTARHRSSGTRFDSSTVVASLPKHNNEQLDRHFHFNGPSPAASSRATRSEVL